MIKSFAFLLFFAVGTAAAQTPAMHVETTAVTRDIAGVQNAVGNAMPATYYRNPLVQMLGGSIRTDHDATVVTVFGDAIRFWDGSPFFVAGNTTYHLAYPVLGSGDALQIPEQFFIQWLPAHYMDNIEYSAGTLRVKNAGVALNDASTIPPRPLPNRTDATGSPRNTPGTIRHTPSTTPNSATGNPSEKQRRIVVIDPGHGGVDSGAEGPNGLEEKDAVLMISNRLAAVLRARGYEVHMTRTTDTLISLADRPRMANAWKGDEPGALFISIHNNSLKSAPDARGFETYFLADANTADERRVADMENAAVKFEKKTSTASSQLDQVLNGLKNDYYLRASNAFADVVQHGMAQFEPGPNRGVKRAGFRVLIGALMPAVLVEVAFISNAREADLLAAAAFQDKLAYSLAESVDTFFHDNEPLWVKQ